MEGLEEKGPEREGVLAGGGGSCGSSSLQKQGPFTEHENETDGTYLGWQVGLSRSSGPIHLSFTEALA